MGSRGRNYSRPLVRSHLSVEEQGEGKVFLIVVEGEKTEPQYLKGLRDRLRLTSAHVVLAGAGATDPANIVRKAIELREERRKLAEESLHVKYDEVWAVFDREAQNHPRGRQMPQAIELAMKNEIRIAVSNPCFEFWLLLHYYFTTKPFAGPAQVIAELCNYIPKYRKADLPISDLMGRIGNAVKHATQCDKHHSDCDGDGNPSSGVHLLAVSLNASAIPSLRCFKIR